MKKEDLYLNSPLLLQNLLINFQGFIITNCRYNKNFRHWYETLKLSDPDKLNEDALSEFLIKTHQTQFWSERFDKYNVQFNKKNNLVSEIQKLPILTKMEVKNNIQQIINKNVGGRTLISHTSGTTGSGLVFPRTLEMENKQWAIWWRYRSWYNIGLDTWMGWFGGRSIASINQTIPPYWRVNYPMRQVMFSAHHLNDKTVHSYFDIIKSRKLTWLHGYPSQLSLLSHLIKNNNLGALPNIKIITLGSENLLSSQKKIIEDVFNVPVKQHYGLAEGVANISEHPDGRLIADQDFAFTEFIPIDNNNPSICKIIGTNYSNSAFPLIRYDTGDQAHIKWNKDGTPIILSINGRQEDYITLPSGVKLGRLDHIFKDLTEIQEAQIFQPSLNHIIIRVVKGHNYERFNQEKSLITEARKRLGNDITISIEYLQKIKKTKAGKLKFVISQIE